DPMLDVGKRTLALQVFAIEGSLDRDGRKLLSALVRDGLDHLAEFDLQQARQGQTEIAFQQVGDAALARLAIDSNDCIVGAAKVGRIDRQIRHFPNVGRLARGEAFFDRILVRTGKRREYEFAAVGVAWMHRQLVAMLDRADDRVYIGEIQAGVDALRVKIKCKRNDVDVTGALAVAEQATFDAIGARHDSEFRGSYCATTIVVRMHRQYDALAISDMTAEPLDLVGIDVWRGHLDRGGKVDDDRALRRRLPHVVYRIANFDGEIQLGAGEAFRRILEHPVGLRLIAGAITHYTRALYGNVDDTRPVEAEHHTSLHRGSRVIQMHDGALGAAQGFERSADQRFTRLRQNLHRDVIGNQFFIDHLAHEIEIGLRSRRTTHLNLLEAGFQQQHEHTPLAFRVHGLDQCLVAVAQVDAAPDRRTGDDAVRPRPVGQRDRGERRVLL